MGADKLLLPWGERTVVESAIAAYRASAVAHIVIVVAPGNEPLAECCRAAGATVVVPERPSADMKASIQAAVRHIAGNYSPSEGDAILVAPGDMPWMRSDVVDRLIDRFVAGSAPVVIATHDGRRGHPVLLSWRLADEILELAEGESLRTVIARHGAELVACDASVLGDLDTAEDYRAACERYGIGDG